MTRPQPKLGMWVCTALVVGNMIGSGVFLLPASLGAYGGVSIAGWLFTAAGALLLALTFGRLARALPLAGGPYAYTRAGLGDFAGFIVAWGYWLSICAGNAAIAVALVGYLAFFVPALSSEPLLGAAAALAGVWLCTWTNARGVREAGAVQVVTTVLKLVPLIAIGTVGLLFLHRGTFPAFNLSGHSDLSAFSATAALTLWAFLGLETATIPAGAVERPEVTIPRATLLGTSAAAAVYILSTVAVMGVIPPAALKSSTAPFADAASTMWGPWAAGAVAAGAAISCFGALNGWVLVQGQLPLAAALDGLLPRLFGRLSGRGTPVAGLVVSSLVVTLVVASNYTKGLVVEFTFIILLATLATLVPYACSTAAFVVLRLRGRADPLAARHAGHPAVAVLAFVYSIWAIVGTGGNTILWGCVLLLSGIPVYLWITRGDRRQPAPGGGDPTGGRSS